MVSYKRVDLPTCKSGRELKRSALMLVFHAVLVRTALARLFNVGGFFCSGVYKALPFLSGLSREDEI